jgi:hypothetical protein
MKEYKVVPFHTGCRGGLSDDELEQTLNKYARNGWQLAKTIHETRGSGAGFFQSGREAHFLILERDADQV